MGAFFTNVQVRVGTYSPDVVRSKVLEALAAWANSNGFEPSDSPRAAGRGEVLRTILVAPADDGQWISVYDELTETQQEDLLAELCTMLSTATHGAVVGIVVHDSDVLGLLLAEDGKIVDHYVNVPDYFGPIPPEEKQAYAGQAELWSPLLLGDASPDHLHTLWDMGTSGAEELLTMIAEAIGIPASRCLMGFNYLTAESPDPPAFARLQFRWTRSVSAEPGELAMMLGVLREKARGNLQVQQTIERLEARLKQFTPTDVAVSIKSLLKFAPSDSA